MNTIEELKTTVKRRPQPAFLHHISKQQYMDNLESKIRQKEIQFRMLVIPDQLALFRQTEAELGELYRELMDRVKDIQK